MEEEFLRIDETLRKERGGSRARATGISAKSMYMENNNLDESLIMKAKSPSQIKRSIKTPSTTHTLRASPHKTRSL